MQLSSPVSSLSKIGPKYKTLLEKLDIWTIEDLLYHFPFRYEDFSKMRKIRDLQPNEQVTVQATLANINNIFTKYGKRITKATLIDYTGETEAIWFNQHYLKTILEVGKIYNFSGEVNTFNNKLGLMSPDFEESNKFNLNTGRLVPVYPETSGISSKWLRTRINDVLLKELEFEEFLPEELLNDQNLKNFNWSLKQIHFPDGLIEAELAHHRFEFEEMFLELLNVERRKYEWNKTFKSHKFKEHSEEIDKLIKSLPFQLTESQSVAVNEILEDTGKDIPMNRLLEGDVGTGKTIVAVIAAYAAHLNGLRTLYMAPTEILAGQHFTTFTKFLENTGVKVQLQTGSKKSKDTDWDILIGTHSLLFNDDYKDIGLVIIDEQHRFGVEQRGKILEMGNGKKVPHLLTMTATPIPRTLALTLYGDLQISLLKTPPNKDKKITTKVVTENARMKAYEWIRHKNEPTFIVCPLIEESESTTLEDVKAAQVEFIKLKESVFKDVEVGLLHGRMKPAEKQEVIENFRAGKYKVLVSTPVIEVGIDIPDATIIVIESAERYGLASLHQLRGRVGRGEKEGFCFAMLSTDSEKALNRLKYLEEINNGLELAEIDMKLRGQGDIFGAMQHGYKQFRIAKIENLEMLKQAKKEAEKIYLKLEEFPKLKEKLTNRKGDYIRNN